MEMSWMVALHSQAQVVDWCSKSDCHFLGAKPQLNLEWIPINAQFCWWNRVHTIMHHPRSVFVFSSGSRLKCFSWYPYKEWLVEREWFLVRMQPRHSNLFFTLAVHSWSHSHPRHLSPTNIVGCTVAPAVCRDQRAHDISQLLFSVDQEEFWTLASTPVYKLHVSLIPWTQGNINYKWCVLPPSQFTRVPRVYVLLNFFNCCFIWWFNDSNVNTSRLRAVLSAKISLCPVSRCGHLVSRSFYGGLDQRNPQMDLVVSSTPIFLTQDRWEDHWRSLGKFSGRRIPLIHNDSYQFRDMSLSKFSSEQFIRSHHEISWQNP